MKRKPGKKQRSDVNVAEPESASKAPRQELELQPQPIQPTEPLRPIQPTLRPEPVLPTQIPQPIQPMQSPQPTNATPPGIDKSDQSSQALNQSVGGFLSNESQNVDHTAAKVYVTSNEQKVNFSIGDIVVVGGDYTFDYSFCRVDDVFTQGNFEKALVTYFTREEDMTLKPLMKNPTKKNPTPWTDKININCIVMGFQYRSGDIVPDDKVTSIKELMSTIFGD